MKMIRLQPIKLVRIVVLLAAVAALMPSCVSRKKLTYLQSSEEITDTNSLFKLSRVDYTLQVNDIVNIDIRSLNIEANTIFNGTQGQTNQNLNAGEIIFYLQGYSVDNKGNIFMPVIGEIKVLGLTIQELSDTLDVRLRKYFNDGSVYAKVQLAGIRFSVVGDISRPGKYIIYQNQATIFEALAMTGDITVVGDRRNVQILRQLPEGIRVYEVDLTDINILSDPRYFLQPNDIINVKPLNVKTWGIGTTGWQSITLGLSALASALTIVFTLNNLSN
jgi:polysaccharide biosynthesis/export protein